MLAPWKKSYDQHRWHIKKQKHYFANESLSCQSYGFSSSHVWMWKLDDKEGSVSKIWCFWTLIFENTLESSLDSKEIQPISPKGNQNIHWKVWYWSWNYNTLATWCEELTHLKRPWCWESWRQEEHVTTEDEMVGWHHWLNGHEFEQALGDGEGQGRLACYHLWGRKASDMTHQWTKKAFWISH